MRSWILQNKEWLFSGAGITVLAAIALFVKKVFFASDTRSDVGEPRFNINVSPNISPVISTNQSSATAASPFPQTEQISRHPQLELLDWKPVLIAYGGWSWCEPNLDEFIPSSEGPNAFIAVFRNKPAPTGAEGTPAYEVTAHLIYRSRDGKQQIIDFGTWLNEYTHFVDFKPGTSHSLILSSKTRVRGFDDKTVYVFDNPASFNPRTRRMRAGITIHAPQEKPMLTDCCEVEISLTSKNITVYHGKLSCKNTPGGVSEFLPMT